MESVNATSWEERQERVQFSIGMAAIDGGKPTDFTQSLLKQYENGEFSAKHLKQVIIENYSKGSY